MATCGVACRNGGKSTVKSVGNAGKTDITVRTITTTDITATATELIGKSPVRKAPTQACTVRV